LKPRRVLVLANKPKGLAPGQRFRLEQWAPRLERDHNITLDLLPFESPHLTRVLYQPGHVATKALWVAYDFLRRAEAVAAARHYDAVVIFREAALIGPAFYERLIAWTGRPIIYDFDDSIWSPAQFSVNLNTNPLFSRLHFFGKTRTICRLAAAITPGNEFLASYARQYNDNVFVVPTSVELDDYPVVPEPASDRPFVVCWTGSTSTLAHFEAAREALERLAMQIPLVVKVICNRPPDRPIAGAEMRFVPWTEEDEAREVGDCHVGIMPLDDNVVTRGKCGLKGLQFMATGRPVVLSPVGVNSDIVRSGENGFLAAGPDEFVDALLQLANSRELRARIGAAGRRTVEERYSAEVVAARFAEVVRFVTEAGALRPQATQ
jgi:glycosyltransferase involved in cell wall biosynthesis